MTEPSSTPPTQPTLSWSVGDLVVHRVPEVELPAETGAWLLPDAAGHEPGSVGWLREAWLDAEHRLRLASQSFAVEVDGQRILVDAGIGNDKERENPAWDGLDTGYLDRLAAAGFPAESIDTVVLTHLHADHVGWCTRLVGGTWEPTFAHARHVVARAEWEHWAGAELEPARRQMLDDSVRPVREAGLVDLVDVASGPVVSIARGVTLLDAPGHTPGHAAVQLSRGGRTVVITGDAVHHPVQVHEPAITSCVDVDPARAVATRRTLLARARAEDHLLLGTHFPDPVAARVERGSGRDRLVPVPPDAGPAG